MNLKKRLASWYMRLAGLKLVAPHPLPAKCVVAAAPHTSNWDFPIGPCVRNLMDVEIGFVGKSSLFTWPLGPIMRWLGGVPVDRSKRNNFVEAVADIFAQRDVFRLTLAP
ncbi:MAG: 1-acyl-sn-glycerol-3-phosphate acyltransferase, partial [Bacteroidota bacterium]